MSEHKYSERALRKSDEHYAQIIESAMDGIIAIDINQRIVLFNAAAAKMFGCKANKAIGGSLEQFLPEQFREAHGEHTRTFDRTGITHRKSGCLGTITGLRANGEQFPIEASISQSGSGDEKIFTAILRDITDRVYGESELHARLKLQDQFAKVAASVPGVICSFRLRLDGSASMPYASPAIESLYGLSSDVLAEDFSPVFARTHPDDIGHINETIAESALTLQPWRDTFRYNHPEKGEIWIEGHSIPLREVDGSVLWHGYIQDVTKRKNTEKELQERIARYELVLDGAQDAIWDWDVLNKRVHFSSRWKTSRGFEEHEVGNQIEEWSDNIHPDNKVHILDAMQAHIEGKTSVFNEEYRIRCKDGSWKWILNRSIAQKDSTGQVIRMAGSESDITQRKLAETQLQDQESELRLIMDATPALIAYLNTEFQYCRVNATYQKWFCIDPETILGLDVREVVGDRAWTIIRPYLERARAGERVHFEQQIPYGLGKPRWVHGSYIPNKDASGIVKGIVVHIFDIDEHIHMEESLRASQQENKFLADLIRNSSQPVAVGYPDGQIGLVNLAFEALTSYTAEELQRIDWATALTPPLWLDIERDKLAELQRTGVPVRYEKEYLRKNGTRVPIELLVHLVTDSEGEPQFYYAFVNDISERKQAADALRSSEAFVHEVLNSLPEHVVVMDDNGVVTAVNEPWERFATDNGGSTCDLSVGANYLDVCRRSSQAGDSDARRAVEGLEAILAGQQQEFIMEYPCPTANGELWFIMHAKRLIDSLKGVIITHIDITEHRRAELALRDTQARLALVVEEVKAGYWDWDLLSNTLYLSPEWKQQIGFEECELANRRETGEDRLHPDDRALVLAATENYIAGRQPVYELDFRLRHKDGSYRWIHCRGALLRDQNNQPYRMLGINLDITDYKNTQELNQRRDQMEQTFRYCVASQTVAAIAHELNQPLTAIYSYADVARQLLQNGNQNPQKLSHILENCALQALRASEVIRELLELLHIGETESEPIAINNSIHDALDFIKADGYSKAYKIELDLATDLSLALSNHLQFQKVVVNLLRNGLESMQESGITAGSITITTRRFTSDPTMVEVVVCDCGKGVQDKAHLKKMFQHFYTTKPTGLGMGHSYLHKLTMKNSIIIE
ncbi:MAG: PAS domain S-box protein [Methylococcales bacterium]|nr:PAS domain S-box protein [Methylococcales bacterium]